MRLARPLVLVDINPSPGSVPSRSRTAASAWARSRASGLRRRPGVASGCRSRRAHAVRRPLRDAQSRYGRAARSPMPTPRAELPLALTVLGGKVTICRPSGRLSQRSSRRGSSSRTSRACSRRPSSSSRRSGRRPGPAPASRSRSSRCGEATTRSAWPPARSGSKTAAPPTCGSGSARSATDRSCCTDLSARVSGHAVDSVLAARDRSRRGRRRRPGRQPARLRRLPAPPDRPPRRAGAAAGVGERRREGEP